MTDPELPHVASVPRSADIAVTGRCNLQCKYCFYADEMAALGDLPPSAGWKNVIVTALSPRQSYNDPMRP